MSEPYEEILAVREVLSESLLPQFQYIIAELFQPA
ncbi:MAG: hypothetical protein JWR69_2390 [Pedosphaera sp.]|nr:hypothetical protein [Pedosphaera sp.]